MTDSSMDLLGGNLVGKNNSHLLAKKSLNALYIEADDHLRAANNIFSGVEEELGSKQLGGQLLNKNRPLAQRDRVRLLGSLTLGMLTNGF